MNVEPITKAVAEHGNKLYNGLSAAALVFLYATFPTKDALQREVDREHTRCHEAACQRWQDAMNFFEMKGRLATIEVGTNSLAVIPPQ